jgi:superfamily II DNA/RNA helicase
MESSFLSEKTFAELTLSPKVQAAVEAAGYTHPTPIQEQAIPIAVTGRDVLGIAQTGTGKTASFVLPMITRLERGRARARMPRSLILAPTRELAAQVAQSFEKYGTNHKLNVALLIGGVSMADQVRKLDRGADVLIATPGRLMDHFQRGKVMLMGVEILVIDEADRMLDMGFIPDIEKIIKLLPPRRQTLFFSATMPPEITRLVKQFLKDPARVEVAKPASTAATITQGFHFCNTDDDWAKRELLRKLIQSTDVRNAIIFCNRKRDVAILFKSLTKHGFSAGALHGDMDQKARMETLDGFRSGEITFLAASDVAARGLDIPDVSHVFNFDLPWQSDDYVHRIGRTGRAGKLGVALSIVTPESLGYLADIEKVTGDTTNWMGEAPTDDDIADAKRGKRRGGRGGKSQDRGRERSSSGRSARGDRNSSRSRNTSSSNAQPEAPVDEKAPTQNDQSASQPHRENDSTEASNAKRPRRRRRGPRKSQSAEGSAPASDTQAAPDADDKKPARERQPAKRGSQRKSPAPSKGRKTTGSEGGFADNVPAFLRKSSRPADAAND